MQMKASDADTERLSLSVAPKLESNLSLLNACLDDVFLEQQTVSQYARALAWQQQQQAQWLQVRWSSLPHSTVNLCCKTCAAMIGTA